MAEWREDKMTSDKVTDNTFVKNTIRGDEEVFSNISFWPIGNEDKEIPEEVFTNGTLPESLTSVPLLPLYQFVVCYHIISSEGRFLGQNRIKFHSGV